MKPKIGLTGNINDDKTVSLLAAYTEAIELAGGVPFVIPYTEAIQTMDELISTCHGIVFTGGADISPEYYGEERKQVCGESEKLRDEFEIKLFSRVIRSGKPILAICRGAQLVNVALGGTLYQDIPTELDTKILHRQAEPKFSHSHSVNVITDTPLSKIVGQSCIKANSFHHQAIKQLGTGLKIMAKANDGIIEAVYSINYPYLLAYQWHPERLCTWDNYNRKIFEDFIEASKGGEK